jgi:hypothetical protein
MIYKLQGKDNDGEWVEVEFELVDGKVCISFGTNNGSGILANLDATEFSDLFSKIKPIHAPDTKKLWIKPMSEAIQEILGGYNLIVAFRDGLDEVTYNSVALEIIELMEAFMVTGKVPEPRYNEKSEE